MSCRPSGPRAGRKRNGRGNYDHRRMKRFGSVVQKFRTARSTTVLSAQADWRQALAARMHALDDAHVDELVDQWFSEETQRLVTAAVQRLSKLATAPAA